LGDELKGKADKQEEKPKACKPGLPLLSLSCFISILDRSRAIRKYRSLSKNHHGVLVKGRLWLPETESENDAAHISHQPKQI
jgi:hypothetical protein